MDTAHIRGRTDAAAAAITHVLASERGFYIILAGFTAQALWFAFSDRYPMAFDESFHFGLIQLHAGQWLPFFTHTPAHSGMYGAVARDPSYLYHYLFSLPYRLLRLATANIAAQIIILRLLNIALFVVSFALQRRLLLRLGSSRAMAHIILLLFSLIPIVPFLAAQINYDNLLIPLLLWSFLATFEWLDMLRQHRISAAKTAILASVMFLTCLVKYAFLPIMVILAGIMLICLAGQHTSRRLLWRSFTASMQRIGVFWCIALLVLTVLSAGLFAERYAVNLWQYHALTPECAKVLRIDQCLEYGPWQRDFLNAQIRPPHFKPDLGSYITTWLYWMWRRCYFAINYLNENKRPLPLPSLTAAVLGIAGAGMFLAYGRSLLRRQPYRAYVLAIIAVYSLTLFAETLRSYLRTAQPVAINGRYLVPFIPFLMLFAGLSFREFLQRIPAAKPYAALAAILLTLQGGGVLTFIVQSDPYWDWPNAAVVNINTAARNVLRPVIYYSYHRDP